jgi:hypothetical protein
MASVKWLRDIEAIDRPFDGVQQASSYHFRSAPGAKGAPCRLMRVNSLMVPPGIPDFYGRTRTVEHGTMEIAGRAWSGAAPITRVDFFDGGEWQEAVVDPLQAPHAWQAWRISWKARPGEHELACRAKDAEGNCQPLEPPWDVSGFGNNGVQRVRVTVRR